MSRSNAQTEEEFFPIVEDPAGDSVQAEPGTEVDTGGLTVMRSWPYPSSPYFYKFKYAAACHDIFNDIYGIAAVFQMKSGETYWDALYYLRVEGDSYEPHYGQLLTSVFVQNSTRIDNVDCSSDNSSSIFITYSRYNNNAVWLRFAGTTKHGPYSIDDVLHCLSGYTYKPRIAFENTANPIVMVVFRGYDYSSGGGSCEICTHTYYAYTGNFINESFMWPDAGNIPGTWDVEWNGDQYFVVPYYSTPDAGPAKLRTAQLDYVGVKTVEFVLEDWGEPGPHPPPPPEMKVVYTDGDKNTEHRFILQTSVGVTYWLEQDGQEDIDPVSPRYNYGGGYGDFFAVCEYWGSISDRIAHTFGYNFFLYPGPPPILIQNTSHRHWDQTPTQYDPHEVYSLNANYYPAACNAADTLTDAEVLLVSRAASGGNKYVYWNMESQ